MSKASLITFLVIGLALCGVLAYTWSVVYVSDRERLAASDASSVFGGDDSASRYTTLEGSTTNVSDYLGNIIVVTTWASWCPSCATELPKLSSLAGEYDQVSFLAINRAEQRTTAERFLRSVNATSGVELILDPEDRYFNSIDGYAMPETLIYNQNGDIVLHIRGDMNIDEVRTVLNRHQQ